MMAICIACSWNKRDAQSFLQNGFQFSARIFNRLFPFPPPQIRMHHISLNRAWTDDGDFNHQVVKRRRLEPRQHALLRAAFHLKDPNGIRILKHGVHRRHLHGG